MKRTNDRWRERIVLKYPILEFSFFLLLFFCRNLNVLPREIIIRIAFARRIDRFIKAMVNSFECLSLSLSILQIWRRRKDRI